MDELILEILRYIHTSEGYNPVSIVRGTFISLIVSGPVVPVQSDYIGVPERNFQLRT